MNKNVKEKIMHKVCLSSCRACNCSSVGSLNASCDAMTGQCSCKGYVIGLKCDTCIEGTFNLALKNVDGCQTCFCFGRSSNCTSAVGFTQAFVYSAGSASSSFPLFAVTLTGHHVS